VPFTLSPVRVVAALAVEALVEEGERAEAKRGEGGAVRRR
jgi:hypothetical protein